MLKWFLYIYFTGIGIVTSSPKSEIPCGLPPFVTKLPQKQNDQLKKVWANYQVGNTCENEQKITFDIIGTLTEAERAAIFDVESEMSGDDHFRTTPRFIVLISPEVKEGFDAIWLDDELNADVKQNQLLKFAKQNFDKEQMESFNSWMSAITMAQKEIDQRINDLSSKAKELFEKLTKIRKEESKLLKSLTPELHKELDGLI
ncbi:hypothetical protein DICVIV_06118 [Dictyocaulus viviparus]|uniref:SXP/RAL-2 family protein Ani s 5-like cation-binding domain-containing protein n=1 Tax=Dictyocaulus viviparus TaxID=29172 RepID=A0A0D8XTD6_DICVI|nr:hypothetical protein DICVIV_06118 [Dictyocaulus viviparus]